VSGAFFLHQTHLSPVGGTLPLYNVYKIIACSTVEQAIIGLFLLLVYHDKLKLCFILSSA